MTFDDVTNNNNLTHDCSGNGNYGDLIQIQPGVSTEVTSARFVDGSSVIVNYPSTVTMTTDFSIVTTIKMGIIQNKDMTIVMSRDTYNPGFELSINSYENSIKFSAGSMFDYCKGNANFDTDKWHTIVVVLAGKQCTIYFDGTPQTTDGQLERLMSTNFNGNVTLI